MRKCSLDPLGCLIVAALAVGLGAAGRAHAVKEWYKPEAKMDELARAMGEMQRECGFYSWIAQLSLV